MNPFSWIRTAARNAFLGGVSDAIEQLNSDPAALTVKVDLPAIAGPAVEEPDTKPKGRKAGQ